MKNQRQRTGIKFGLGLVLIFALSLSGCGGGGSSSNTGGSNTPRGSAVNNPINQSGGSKQTALNITANAGVVSTLAGNAHPVDSFDGTGTAATFLSPRAITSDGTNLYVADTANSIIRKVVISSGVVTTFAGTPLVQGSTDGTGSAALFNQPAGITTDGTNLYVADSYNGTIRKIVISTGVVTTLVGASAQLCGPSGITTDGVNLFVSDTINHTIRKIVISSGVVTTLAGTAGTPGSADGASTAARFNRPYGISTDGTNLYVADSYNSTIRQIAIATGVVTTMAGTAGTAGTSGSTDGIGTAARFNGADGITTAGSNLFIADTNNGTIRQIVIAGSAVSTLAGKAGNPSRADGTGPTAQFLKPNGVTTDGTNLYVADRLNSTIRKVVISTGVVTTLAGTALTNGSTDATGTAARFNYPYGITTDGTNLYVADTLNSTVRQIVISTGAVTTLAGKAGNWGGADGTGVNASFYYPAGITTDGTNLYVTDIYNGTIRKIVISSGVVTTLAGANSGSADGYGTGAQFYGPSAITTDGASLYVADTYNHTIREIVISSGAVTTLAGKAGNWGGADGIGANASFYYPAGITTDGANLYVADTSNHTIRKIVISSRVVTTIAGTAGTSGSADGTTPAALFNLPSGITTDGANLYVADSANNTIRKIH